MEYRLIVFDLDGTLVDSLGDHVAGIAHMRASFGLAPLSSAEVAKHIGHGLPKLAEDCLQDAPGVDLEKAKKELLLYFDDCAMEHSSLLEGVEEFFSRDFPWDLAVLTNKPQRHAESILERFALRSCFSTVVGSDTLLVRKPDPKTLHYVLKQYELPPQKALMVGDHHTDMEVALRSSVDGAYIRSSMGSLDRLNPKYKFENFSEFSAFIQKKTFIF